MKNPFIFFADVLEFEKGVTQIDLFEGYVFKQANDSQIEHIKKFLEPYTGLSPLGADFNFNRYDWRVEKNGEAFFDKRKSNYKILEYSVKTINERHVIKQVLSLSKLDLTILFNTHPQEHRFKDAKGDFIKQKVFSNIQSSLANLNHHYDTSGFMYPSKFLGNNEVEELKYLYEIVSGFEEEKYPIIQNALNDFLHLNFISNHSPFKVVSYFALLEFLLTAESKNRISQQLIAKLALLNNQFSTRIDIFQYFKGSSSNTIETIIKLLYSYRSDIAHGNRSNFNKELKLLDEQRDMILPFLRDLVKKVLIYSMKNPQIITDLKKV